MPFNKKETSRLPEKSSARAVLGHCGAAPGCGIAGADLGSASPILSAVKTGIPPPYLVP